jgi:hypothetical protein
MPCNVRKNGGIDDAYKGKEVSKDTQTVISTTGNPSPSGDWKIYHDALLLTLFLLSIHDGIFKSLKNLFLYLL